ncbi:MAG TPA: hypothetical protein VIG33_09860 [Pseudobdellovibrionaceae bacterium]|jgi:hypothetical protein
MKNILLAITSFFATVLILSQVALAEDDENGDPKHTSSATSEEPNSSQASDKTATEAGVPNPGHKCKEGTCYQRVKGGRLGDSTNPKPSSGSKTQDSSKGEEGRK